MPPVFRLHSPLRPWAPEAWLASIAPPRSSTFVDGTSLRMVWGKSSREVEMLVGMTHTQFLTVGTYVTGIRHGSTA